MINYIFYFFVNALNWTQDNVSREDHDFAFGVTDDGTETLLELLGEIAYTASDRSKKVVWSNHNGIYYFKLVEKK